VRVHFLEPHPEFDILHFHHDWTPRHPDSKFNRRSQLQKKKIRIQGVAGCGLLYRR